MKIFNCCIFHNWNKKSKYYDCSAICMWSSGTEYYKLCKDCRKLESRNSYEKLYKEIKKDSSEYNFVMNEVFVKKNKKKELE